MEEDLGFFEQPILRVIIKFSLLLVAYFLLEFLIEDKAQGLSRLFIDFGLFIAGLILWTVFFSQFILPVRTLGDRLAIFDRLMAYFSGFHGPAIFIENGNIRARQDEREKRGPGVLWLDQASAAMLRTATRFTRTIGPGVHFTKAKEYIAATVNLHTLTQTIGPNDNENPFTVAKEDENYQRIQDSGMETRALTRDGIPVIAQISVTFCIEAQPGEGNSIYGYNQENVRKVITESMVQGVKTDQPVWSPLPAKMAVEIWREYLSRFRLNQLFQSPPGETRTNLQIISELVKNRLGQDVVNYVDEFGDFTGRTISSREHKILADMGVKVLGVNIKRVIFQEKIEQEIAKSWNSLWAKTVKKEKEQIEQEHRVREEKGQMDAQIEFANIMTSEIRMPPRNKRDAVYLLTHGISQSVIRNLGLMKKISRNDTSALTGLARWLKGE
jgi:regulator of protease activity HflC (stomatin/prohibitin superfamily)